MSKEEMIKWLEKANSILEDVKGTLEVVENRIPVDYCEKDMEIYRRRVKYAILHGVPSLKSDIKYAEDALKMLRD